MLPNTIYAEIVYENSFDDIQQVALRRIKYERFTSYKETLHEIQFGGSGDGYCYYHQSFDCIDSLTKEEWDAFYYV